MRSVAVPGDKSLTHRALLLAALAEGESRIRGALPGEDCRSTAAALRALGVPVPEIPEDGREFRIRGVGLRGLRPPSSTLDMGNSGTTTRLLMGVLAGQEGIRAVLDGDDSLRSRPMRRVTGPLSLMGARFRELGAEDRLPIEVEGAPLRFLDYPSPVSSAQVKSALILAGLAGGVPVQITEPRRSRDHTERLLSGQGVGLVEHATEAGWRVELRDPPASIAPLDLTIPGDFSSAAFLLALALLGAAGPGLRIRGVGVNPTRTGFLGVLEEMGAGIGVREETGAGIAGGGGDGEPVGDLVVEPRELSGVTVGGERVPEMVDELPLLGALAARARGETRVTGAEELRVKETDRIRAVVENLRAVGARAEELPDGFVVQGSDEPLRGRVRAFGDHRIAMAFAVLGRVPGNDIRVDDRAVVDVSFPGFWDLLDSLGAG